MSNVSKSTVFVVSGGAKGITAQCVIELARHHQCKFILLGRSKRLDAEPAWANGIETEPDLKKAAVNAIKETGEKPTPNAVNRAVKSVLSDREIQATLNALSELGSEAVYASADITDRNAVQSALNSVSHLGTITGIIHGAGNLADKLIEKKTPDDFEWVYSAKVDGLQVLLDLIPASQIEFLVLFSSVAGFYGNVGQADYAIANEILNKTAHRFQTENPSAKVVSINWGPWDGGMVSPQLRAYFDELNIKIIPVDVGTQMLVDELQQPAGSSNAQIVVGSAINAPPAEPDENLKIHEISRVLSLEASPFLQDHVVDHKAVMPMVTAMSWMSSSAEQLYPGYHYFGFDNYKVLKGIVFDDTLADKYTLELKEVEKTASKIVVEAMIRSTSNGKPRFHYSAQLTLLDKIPPAPSYTPEVDPDAEEINKAGEILYNDGTLFHRYSFKGVEQVLTIGPKGLIMRCHLNPVDAAYQGQFPVQAFNYYMADVGLQSIGIWARHNYDAGSLPLRAMHGEHFLNFDFGETFYVHMEVLSVSQTDVAARITLYDESGKLYFQVSDIAVTMNKRLNEMFLRNTLANNS